MIPRYNVYNAWYYQHYEQFTVLRARSAHSKSFNYSHIVAKINFCFQFIYTIVEGMLWDALKTPRDEIR